MRSTGLRDRGAEARAEQLRRRLGAERARDAAGDGDSLGLRAAGKEDRELVAAEAERLVLLADGVGQNPGEPDQLAIAGLVAVVVVDLLEAVEVAEDERQRDALPLAPRELGLEAMHERAPIQESRERVALRERAHLLELPQRLERRRPTAAGDRPARRP